MVTVEVKEYPAGKIIITGATFEFIAQSRINPNICAVCGVDTEEKSLGRHLSRKKQVTVCDYCLHSVSCDCCNAEMGDNDAQD